CLRYAAVDEGVVTRLAGTPCTGEDHKSAVYKARRHRVAGVIPGPGLGEDARLHIEEVDALAIAVGSVERPASEKGLLRLCECDVERGRREDPGTWCCLSEGEIQGDKLELCRHGRRKTRPNQSLRNGTSCETAANQLIDRDQSADLYGAVGHGEGAALRIQGGEAHGGAADHVEELAILGVVGEGVPGAKGTRLKTTGLRPR